MAGGEGARLTAVHDEDSTRPVRSGSFNGLSMASSSRTGPQTSQRVKVGAIGLAVVVLLIALASAVLGSASRERAATAPGGAKPDIVANMALGNEAGSSEPLADMGVTPGVHNGSATDN
jgi:hypothetical protein